MKLFVWEDVLEDVLEDYSTGKMFALAKNAHQARNLIIDKFEKENEYISSALVADLETEPRVIENSEGFYIYGSS